MCAEWIRANISGYVAVDAAAVDAVAVAAVEKFKEMLSEVAKAILADSGDKNFSLDIQNIILAFAGRVLLRKALITPDDYENWRQICPLFEPVYVFYDENKAFYQELADVQREILAGP